MKKIIHISLLMLVTSLLFSCSFFERGVDNITGVKMIAEIKAIHQNRIEVEVVSGDYEATGPYSVITNTETVFLNAEGTRISMSKFKVGNTIEITYGGQVMLSYPPQIVARKIQLTK